MMEVLMMKKSWGNTWRQVQEKAQNQISEVTGIAESFLEKSLVELPQKN